jgi:hypothetical protein
MSLDSRIHRTTWTVLVLCAISGCGDQGAADARQGARPADEVATTSTPQPQARAEPNPSPTKKATFLLVEMPPASTGVGFLHVSGNSSEKPFPAANGSGVGAIDYDRDGLIDIYFATGTHFPLDAARQEPANKIYRNRGGWIFEDVTAGTGLGHVGYSSGITVGDYDSDGFPDLYVTCFGDDVLYRNLGDGTCENVPIIAGGNFSTSAAFLDYDADGLLDL